MIEKSTRKYLFDPIPEIKISLEEYDLLNNTVKAIFKIISHEHEARDMDDVTYRKCTHSYIRLEKDIHIENLAEKIGPDTEGKTSKNDFELIKIAVAEISEVLGDPQAFEDAAIALCNYTFEEVTSNGVETMGADENIFFTI